MSFCLHCSSTQSSRPHPVTVCVSVCHCVCVSVCVCVCLCWKCVSKACRKLASGSGNSECVCASWLSAWFTQYDQAPVGHAFVCLSVHTLTHTQTLCISANNLHACVWLCVCERVCMCLHAFATLCVIMTALVIVQMATKRGNLKHSP